MKHSVFSFLLAILFGLVATTSSAKIAVKNDDGVTIYYSFNYIYTQ